MAFLVNNGVYPGAITATICRMKASASTSSTVCANTCQAKTSSAKRVATEVLAVAEGLR